MPFANSAAALNTASFILPLADAGAGVVNTTLYRGTGSPTFVRATTAYTRLSTGLYALIASGSPRSMYSAAGVYLGYWVEGARANVLGGTDIIVRTMSDAGWVAGATMTKGTATGVDGTAGIAASMTGGAVSATNIVLFTTVLGAAVRTFSAWVRRKTGTGTVNITVDNGSTWTPIVMTSAYQQFQVTSASVANQVCGFQIITSGDAIEIDFNMLEAASFANPTPIPVNVSKAADVLTYASAGNIVGTLGTAYAEITCARPTISGASPRVIDSGPASASIPIYFENITGKIALYDGTAAAVGTAITPPVTSPLKLATAWGGTTCSLANAGTVTSAQAFDGDLNVGATIQIGNTALATGNELFGSIKNANIWFVKQPDAVIGALTS